MGKVKKEMLRRNYAFEVRAEQDEKHGAIITGTPIVYESKRIFLISSRLLTEGR